MADEDPNVEDPKVEDPEKDQPDPPEDPEKDEPEEKGQEKKDLDPEVRKAQRRRDAALTRAQKAEEEAKRLRDKYEPEKADPVKVANRRLVTAESRVVMTAAGITDREDQQALASFLDLDSVAVDDDGTVDSDAIQERLEKLAGILGKAAKKTRPPVPRVETKDRGGEKAKPTDSATARRKAMLGY